MDIITFNFFMQRWAQSLIRWGFTIIPLFLAFTLWKPKFLDRFAVQQFNSSDRRYGKEFLQSVLVFTVYTIPAFVLIAIKHYTGYSPIYTNISLYGIPYFALSIFIFIFTLDTIIFWEHYAQHKIKFLRNTHALHHKSVSTSSLTAYSVNLSEAFLNMLPFLPVVIFIPWHPLAYLIFAKFALFSAGYTHSGYDFTFDKLNSKPKRFFWWYYSPTHHSLHHQKFECNYGLYFTFWDKIMGTEDFSFERSKYEHSA